MTLKSSSAVKWHHFRHEQAGMLWPVACFVCLISAFQLQTHRMRQHKAASRSKAADLDLETQLLSLDSVSLINLNHVRDVYLWAQVEKKKKITPSATAVSEGKKFD